MGRAVLKGPDFFFLLRTALKDRPKGLPTANRQLPSTANRQQPPTATNRQPPTAANRQRRPTANCQPLPTATNHQSPTTNCRQPPPTATNRQLPTANCQPPTANRHQPWLSTWSARGLFWENWFWNTFFFPLRTALLVGAVQRTRRFVRPGPCHCDPPQAAQSRPAVPRSNTRRGSSWHRTSASWSCSSRPQTAPRIPRQRGAPTAPVRRTWRPSRSM